MVTTQHLAESILEQLETREMVRLPAAEAEYLAMAEEFPHRLDYHEGESIAIRLATAIHELLVTYINRLLANHFFDRDFLVINSNAGLHIERKDRCYYQPDLMLTNGESAFKSNLQCLITL